MGGKGEGSGGKGEGTGNGVPPCPPPQFSIVIVECPLCIVHHQQLLQRTSPPKLLAGVLPNLAGMVLTWPSLIIVQKVMVRCISKSHRLKIDFRDENFKKSSSLKPQGLEP